MNRTEAESTGMTRLMLASASSGTMTEEEAVRYLSENARFRTVRETLERAGGFDSLEEKGNRRKLVDLLLETNPSAKRDSLEKNVRNWTKEDTCQISRENAILLLFALKPAEEKTEEIMTRLCGESFHWRNPEDLVWLYGLRNGLTWAETSALRNKMKTMGLLIVSEEESSEPMTSLIRDEAESIRTEEELADFLREARSQLGVMHNTAYSLFISFMDLLGLPQMDDGLPDVNAMPVREIISTYLYDKYIPRAQRAGGEKKNEADVRGAIERDIRQNWPEETVLSKMLHRQTDVTRKVLILLFLACDGGESDYGDWTDETTEDLFEDMYARMDSMLRDCGFAPLDARSPFDWMVLYCMCADESLFIEDTVRNFLTGLFPPEETNGNEPENGPET